MQNLISAILDWSNLISRSVELGRMWLPFSTVSSNLKLETYTFKHCLTHRLDMFCSRFTNQEKDKKILSDRGSREELERKTKDMMKKLIWFLFVFLKKLKFNRDRNQKAFKTSPTDWKELKRPESFSLKLEFSFPFSISQKIDKIDQILKKQKFFEKFGKNFCRNICRLVFMIWNVCSWFQMFYKTKLF